MSSDTTVVTIAGAIAGAGKGQVVHDSLTYIMNDGRNTRVWSNSVIEGMRAKQVAYMLGKPVLRAHSIMVTSQQERVLMRIDQDWNPLGDPAASATDEAKKLHKKLVDNEDDDKDQAIKDSEKARAIIMATLSTNIKERVISFTEADRKGRDKPAKLYEFLMAVETQPTVSVFYNAIAKVMNAGQGEGSLDDKKALIDRATNELRDIIAKRPQTAEFVKLGHYITLNELMAASTMNVVSSAGEGLFDVFMMGEESKDFHAKHDDFWSRACAHAERVGIKMDGKGIDKPKALRAAAATDKAPQTGKRSSNVCNRCHEPADAHLRVGGQVFWCWNSYSDDDVVKFRGTNQRPSGSTAKKASKADEFDYQKFAAAMVVAHNKSGSGAVSLYSAQPFAGVSSSVKSSIIDSGAYPHMVSRVTKDRVKVVTEIGTANGSMMSGATGTLPLTIHGEPLVELKGALECSVTEPLISVSALLESDFKKVQFDVNGWHAQHASDRSKDLKGPRRGGLFYLAHDAPAVVPMASYAERAKSMGLGIRLADPSMTTTVAGGKWESLDASGKKVDGGTVSGKIIARLSRDCSHDEAKEATLALHKRLGHMCLPQMKELAKAGSVIGLSTGMLSKVSAIDCEDCLVGKLNETRIPKVASRSPKAVLDLVQVDLTGPITPASLGGHRYVLTIIDRHTGRRFTDLLASRQGVSAVVIARLKQMAVETGLQVKTLRSDNEFDTLLLKKFAEEVGMVQEFTMPASSFSNGGAERTFRTLFDLVRTALSDSGLPKSYWAEAVNWATYVLNRVLTVTVTRSNAEAVVMSSLEAYSGNKPKLTEMRPFGADCFANFSMGTGQRKKLDERGVKCHYLGPAVGREGHRVLIADTKQIRESRSVRFLEDDVQIPHSRDLIEIEDMPSAPGAEIDVRFELSEPSQDIPQIPSIPPPVEGGESGDGVAGVVNDEDIDAGDPDLQVIPTTPSGSNSPAPSSDFGDESERESDVEEVDLEIPGAFPAQTMQDAAEPGLQQQEAVDAPAVPSDARPNDINAPPAENKRVSKKTQWFGFHAMQRLAMRAATAGLHPTSVAEAKMRPDWTLWEEALKSEIDSWISKGVIERDDDPVNRPLGTRMVFDIKPGGKHKCRMPVLGYMEVEGRDYFDVFSAVVRMESVKIFFQIVASLDLYCLSLDVRTAFLNVDMPENTPIWIRLPPGVAQFLPAEMSSAKSFRLRKGAYGLHSSSQGWNKEADKQLRKLGFIPCRSDPCCYVMVEADGSRCYLLLYVDDILVAHQDHAVASRVKEAIKNVWECKDNGEVTEFLGIRVVRDRACRQIHLSQERLMMETLEAAGMLEANAVKSPYDVSVSLQPGTDSDEYLTAELGTLYQQVIGMLLYIARNTRYDLLPCVSMLGSFASKPTTDHLTALKRLLRYCVGTSRHGITLGGREPLELRIHADASYAGADQRRSRSGVVSELGGGITSAISIKEKTVAMSTCEAEIMALTQGVKEAMWLKALLEELGFPQSCTVVKQDNTAAIAWAGGHSAHQRSKHIDVRHYFVRDKVEDGSIRLEYCPTKEMLADLMTKPLAAPEFMEQRDRLGIRSLEDFEGGLVRLRTGRRPTGSEKGGC